MKYKLELTKDELNTIKQALSIAQIQLKYKSVNSAMWGNIKASEAYGQQEQKIEVLLKRLMKIGDNNE